MGVDLSLGQLRHAVRRLPVPAADATALPLADASVPAAVCVPASTDVPVGDFAERGDASVVVDSGYATRSRRAPRTAFRTSSASWH